MPKFEKGSKEAREHMEKLRSLKKGNGSSHPTRVEPLSDNNNRNIVNNAQPYSFTDQINNISRGNRIIDLTNIPLANASIISDPRTPINNQKNNRRRNAIKPEERPLIISNIGTGIKKIKNKN